MNTIDTATDPIVATRKPVRKAAPVAAGAPDDFPRPLRRRRGTPWVRRMVVFATCVLLADALFGDWGLARTFRARRDYGQAAANLTSLRHENAMLRDLARRLQEDPRAIEAVAREELGLIRPGEILVVVKDLQRPSAD